VLFLVSAHGGLSQAAQVALSDLGHEVSVAVVGSAEAMLAAVRDLDPDLIACPMLKTMIPESIWSRYRCLIVHPGPVGDRGPSSIDWAIMLDLPEWGVTVLEANGEYDAGTVWATRSFARLSATKSGMSRHEVRRAAVDALTEAVDRIARGETAPPQPAANTLTGQARPLMRQEVRRIDWTQDSTDLVLRKIHSGDGQPGVLDFIEGVAFHLFGAHRESTLRGRPGRLIAQRDGAICRATVDGSVWITHLKRRGTAQRRYIKLPAVAALTQAGRPVTAPEIPAPPIGASTHADAHTYREIRYQEEAGVGYLHFDFYNGAMSDAQCRRLRDAYRYARSRPTRVIVLMGGRDFFCTGIHLNVIESAADPATESWHNLNAINDVVHDVVTTDSHYVIAALCGDAAAGGVPFALAADRVLARENIVLNPYYQHMGGLYGSEYWTYLLPRRLGTAVAGELTSAPFTPVSARRAVRIGLVDDAFGASAEQFTAAVHRSAAQLAQSPLLPELLALKRRQRDRDERAKPLLGDRHEELARSHECFFGPDKRYHHARTRFTHKQPGALAPS
jgi:putative two-component system hydrogenase maturation factor HypX/HoxX